MWWYTHIIRTLWRPDNAIASSRPACLQSVGGLRSPSAGMWHGVGILDLSRCVRGYTKNTGTRVKASLMETHLFLGAHCLAVLFLGRAQSLSPGACPLVAMWDSTASLTSWSASQSLRASASTFSVWVSGLVSGRRWMRLLGAGALLCWGRGVSGRGRGPGLGVPKQRESLGPRFGFASARVQNGIRSRI